MGLIDVAPLFSDENRIPLRLEAQSVASTYQRQSVPYPPIGEPLRQSAGGKSDLALLSNTANSPLGNTNGSTTAIAWTLAQWPAPRLQLVGGEIVPLLFDVPAIWMDYLRQNGSKRPIPRRLFECEPDGLPLLRCLPGGVEALLRVGPLLREVIEARWVNHVAATNKLVIDPATSLRQFLFPAQTRQPIPLGFRRELLQVQRHSCFWCQKKLKSDSAAVDHVVPWSISRNDAVQNLVLAHQRCNLTKSDLLPHPLLANRWLRHLRTHQHLLNEIADRYSMYSSLQTSVAWLLSQYRLLDGRDRVVFFTVRDGEPCVREDSTETIQKLTIL
jgi:hypothetical protein